MPPIPNAEEGVYAGERIDLAQVEQLDAQLREIVHPKLDEAVQRLADQFSWWTGREVRKLLQERALVAARQAGLDRLAIEEVGKLHRETKLLAGAVVRTLAAS